jgi:uncharacterized membrane protein
MRVSEKGVLAVALVAALGSISALTFTSPVLRTLFGLPLVFYLPGYAILRAAFRELRTGLAGTVFAAGLSIAVAIFCGFVLHLAGGLTPKGWAIALGAVTLVACGAAYVRDCSPSSPRRQSARDGAPTAGQVMVMICAAMIAAGAVTLARQWAIAHPEFTYTEFWIVPHIERREAFTIGVKNAERTPSSYDLELMLDNRTVAVLRSIQLRIGETWISDFFLPMESGTTHTAEARLFRNGDSHLVYRRVWLKTEPET